MSWFNLLWFLLFLAVGIAAAAAMHHWIEKPVERLMRAWKDARVPGRLS